MPGPEIQLLVLEDNVSDFELVKRQLKKACQSCSVEWAKGKAEFTRALAKRRPDIVLLDYNLPGFGGLAGLKLAREKYPNVPAVIVSGAIGEEVAIEAMKAGATDYVLKDRLERLGPVVIRALDEAEQLERRRKAEKELEETKGRLEAIVSQMPIALLVVDTKANVTSFVNEEGRRLFSLDTNPDRELSRNLHSSIVIYDLETNGEPDHAFIQNAIRDGTLISNALKKVLGPNEKQFFGRVSVAPVRDKDGNAIAAVVMIRDVTDQVYAQRKIKSQADALARSNAELQQFAYVASHDLQEPLRMISGHLSIIEKRLKGKLDEKTEQNMWFVLDAASRMRQLIDDLLQYSRVDTREVQLGQVDMNLVVAHVTEMCEVAIQESGGRVVAGPLPVIQADEVQMTELLQNLVSNGLKFHGNDPPRVEISATEERDRWIIAVKDNGIGIDPKYQEKIFGMFTRLNARSAYPGTGIGLAVAKKIVERRGGRIWVEAQLGAGSTFSFSVPKVPPPTVAQEGEDRHP
jgi:signal transduction histidine kinase